MYDVLVYLFENCQQADLAYDGERVARKLSAAGIAYQQSRLSSIGSKAGRGSISKSPM